MKQQIFIFGYYGWKNTGDDGMIYALLQELHILDPTATFAIFSQMPVMVPKETMNLVKFVRPIPQAVFREIMHSSIFIMGGGTQIYDYGSKTKRLKIMSEMLILLSWAKLFCKRIYLLGIGVEPLSTNWGRFLSKQMCWLADFVSVRDKLSYEILEPIGVKNKITLSFDLTALLQPLSIINDNYSFKNIDTKILGVSILPFFEIYHGDTKKDRLFVNEIAKGLNYWLKKDPHNLIHLFVFKGKSKADDVLITEMLRKQLESPDRVKLIPYNSSPVGTLYQVARCQAFIGMRYHSCVFAYLTNTPLLIISYFQKCQAFAEDVGLSKHAVISLGDILTGKFETHIKKIQQNPDQFIATLPVDVAKRMAKKGFPKDEIGDLL